MHQRAELLMTNRATKRMRHAFCAVAAFLILVAGPTAAQSMPDLPETTLRAIAASPEKYIERLLSRMDKLNPDGPVTLYHVRRDRAVHTARARARHLKHVLGYDLDGDGRVTRAEYRTRADSSTPEEKHWRKFTEAADTDRNGTLSSGELYAYADNLARRKRPGTRSVHHAYDVSQFDSNGDQAVTRDEVRSRVAELGQELARLKTAPATDSCAPPVPPPGAEIVLLGAYDGAGLSTVATNGMERVTTVGAVVIEPGDRRLYIFAAAAGNMIWKVSGAIERVARFVVQPPRSQLGPGTGVTGLPASAVAFVAPGACFKPFHEPAKGLAGKATVIMAKALGVQADEIVVAGQYELHEMRLPSGEASSTKRAGYLGITFSQPKKEKEEPSAGQRKSVTGSGLALPQGQKVEATTSASTTPDPGPDPVIAELTKALRRYHFAGVIEIDPAEVVAPGVVRTYDVLPMPAGAIQLLQRGVIRKTSKRTFTVLKPVPRLPAGWDRISPQHRFAFAKGVSRTDRGPGRADSWIFQ